jgi:protein-disulfide isomerase
VGESPQKWRKWLDTAASVATLVAAAGFLWMWVQTARSLSPPKLKLSGIPEEVRATASLGSVDAPIVVVEYADFQCPYSAKTARETLPLLKGQYVDSGRVEWLYKQFPLPQHEHAVGAAVGAECAAAVGKFWEMHDALFANQKQLSPEDVGATALSLGLSQERYQSCIKEGAAAARVQGDEKEALKKGLSMTPTILVGLRLPDGRIQFVDSIEGSAPLSAFREALDKAGETGLSTLQQISVAAGILVSAAAIVFLRRRQVSRRKKLVPGGP